MRAAGCQQLVEFVRAVLDLEPAVLAHAGDVMHVEVHEVAAGLAGRQHRRSRPYISIILSLTPALTR